MGAEEDVVKWKYDVFEEMSEDDQATLRAPWFGWGHPLLGKALAIMHQEMFGEGQADCVWAGGVVSDMMRCAHGYMVYTRLIARTMGLERN